MSQAIGWLAGFVIWVGTGCLVAAFPGEAPWWAHILSTVSAMWSSFAGAALVEKWTRGREDAS